MNVWPRRSISSADKVPPSMRRSALALHELTQELDEGQHELGEALLEVLRICVHAARQRRSDAVELRVEEIEVAASGQDSAVAPVARRHESPPREEKL